MTVTDLGNGNIAVTFETVALTISVLDALIAELGLPSQDHAIAYAIARTYQRECQAQGAPPLTPQEPVGYRPPIDGAARAQPASNVCRFPVRRA